MRRFRLRRRRYAAAVLLPLAATISATALGADAAAPTNARLDTSARTVPVGETVTMRGQFPGAPNAAIELRFRAAGSSTWRTQAADRTGASGRYRVRVRPRASGYWRAELADPALAQGATPLDGDTAPHRVTVRSRTVARVTDRNPTVGDTVRVRGNVTPSGAKRRVAVRIGGERDVVRAGRDGRFELSWRAERTGTYPVRVRARSNRLATGSRDRGGRLTVYRPAAASWYGPGLYGNALACGGTLSASTMGVAHRTLPCGTRLRLRYHGRSVAVRVIDRGPFAGGREFDLTAATKEALGFPDVGTVLSSR